MNIWEWVAESEAALRDAGEDRLADLIDALPNAVCNDDHARVDAIVPEALAHARRLGHAWLEVFIRHWELQSRVFERFDVARALGDAVRLLDFAHEEETRDCPQGVCAVQDLAACYGLIDGPGYAAERLAVTQETLERINPSWPCFQCVALEHAEAIRDGGDPRAALAYVDAQLVAVERTPGVKVRNLFASQRIEALIDLGRFEEALASLEQVWQIGESRSDDMRQRLTRVRLLACVGREVEAERELPPAEEVAATPGLHVRWTEAVRVLVKTGARDNSWQLGVTLHSFASRLSEQGAIGKAIRVWHVYAELAVARGAVPVAERAAGAVEALLPKLAKSRDAAAELARLRAAIGDAKPDAGAEEELDEAVLIDRLLALADADPERAAELSAQARKRFAGSEAIALAHARAVAALGWTQDASAALEGFFSAHPESADVAAQLAELYAEASSPEKLAAFELQVRARSADARTRGRVSFYGARRLRSDGRFSESNRALEPVLVELPDSVGTRRLFADNCMSLRDFAGALAKLDEAVAIAPEAGSADWERMTAATILGAWDKVRASAARLGVELSGDGEIDEHWSLCRLELPAPPSDVRKTYFARRTGPVTARILSMAHPAAGPQVYGDVWAFDASPQNPPPQKGEEEDHTFLYPAVHRLREGHYAVFELEGVHPGDEAIARLREQLQARTAAIHVLSDDEDRIAVEGEDLRRIYARVAIPPAVPARELAAIVRDVLADVAHPLVHVALAKAVGDPPLIEEHEKRAKRYAID